MEYLQYGQLFDVGHQYYYVLNLIINGIPSIHLLNGKLTMQEYLGFKPYYKWNTFNTVYAGMAVGFNGRFKPYYKWNTFNTITEIEVDGESLISFKPYYKWNTFNTSKRDIIESVEFIKF